jgi:hypothetical protein
VTPRYSVSSDSVTDQETGLVWQRTVDSQTFFWDNATTYCPNAGLSGTGWRLPDLNELFSLVDPGTSPSIDQTVFPGAPAYPFWTSDSFGQLIGYWAVDFSDGTAHQYNPQDSYFVRCVR